jgi:hypothetical protein
MSETTTQTTETTESSSSKRKLQDRFARVQETVKARVQAAEGKVRSRAQALPTELKSRVATTVTALRDRLDLPSRAEVAALASRIDLLDQKLAQYETGSATRAKKAKAE